MILDQVPARVVRWLKGEDVVASTTISPESVKERIVFNSPAKRYMHPDHDDSSRSYYGIVARLGDNITYTCDLTKFVGNPLYNITSERNTRYAYE